MAHASITGRRDSGKFSFKSASILSAISHAPMSAIEIYGRLMWVDCCPHMIVDTANVSVEQPAAAIMQRLSDAPPDNERGYT